MLFFQAPNRFRLVFFRLKTDFNLFFLCSKHISTCFFLGSKHISTFFLGSKQISTCFFQAQNIFRFVFFRLKTDFDFFLCSKHMPTCFFLGSEGLEILVKGLLNYTVFLGSEISSFCFFQGPKYHHFVFFRLRNINILFFMLGLGYEIMHFGLFRLRNIIILFFLGPEISSFCFFQAPKYQHFSWYLLFFLRP